MIRLIRVPTYRHGARTESDHFTLNQVIFVETRHKVLHTTWTQPYHAIGLQTLQALSLCLSEYLNSATELYSLTLTSACQTYKLVGLNTLDLPCFVYHFYQAFVVRWYVFDPCVLAACVQ